MTRNIRQRGWIRTSLVLALLSAVLMTLFLLRPQQAQAIREAAREVFITPPLAVAPGQSAEIAFFLPGGQGGGADGRIPIQMRLLDAETGQVLAQKDVVAGDGPGGGCLQFSPGIEQTRSRQQIVGILIGLLKPSAPHPVASLQILNTETQQTMAAVPAVQLIRTNSAD